MKKFFISVALLASMTFSSCVQPGTTNGSGSMLGTILGGLAQGQTDNGTTNMNGEALKSVLGALLGATSTVKQADVVGTWYYSGSDCVFESENLLMQAGGEIAAGKIETQIDGYLAKVGIKPGSCSYAFASDGTYTATLGAYNLSGEYEISKDGKTITMTYLNGLGTVTAHVVRNANSISILYEADKLLGMMKKVPLLSKSSAVSSLTKLLDNYDGLLIGMQMKM